ncbi:mediator of RNA polymerase II transcription subunit 26-like [Danio aesculapii]|uniref:mediator of RNA polymerase II transcription subunit 26-like n=1 Tax=Danio aesculapii TaxID=1142201 RepID=UPI0024C01430|nr:mediator of RNA polymerase II transcription subunit 26-like [Danio aesculapii]
MVAVLDVICCLESYPMTKEALEETRLGKLINDVRKRSTDKYLVKRLKKLVRRWQTLVGINEGKEPNLSSLADQVNSTSAQHGSAQTRTENNSQSIFQNRTSQTAEVSRDSLSGKTINYTTSFRKSKIPILANRLYCSSIKHLQHFTSFRTPLPIQHCQDDHNVIIRDQRTLQKYSISDNHHIKHVLSAQEPAQYTCITSSLQDSYLQQSSDLLKILKPAAMINVNLDVVSSTVTDTNMRTFQDKMRKDQHNNHIVKYDGCPEECSGKTTPHEAKLTYDPHTRQIQTTANKLFPKACQKSLGSDFHGTEHLEESVCSSQQTNWREMSKLIQNSLPTSERSEIDFSRDENVTQNNPKECRKTFLPGFHVMDLPGVSRAVTKRDLTRVRSQRWHGVNGCFDNRNNWYEWTQSITLDPYGDGSKLQILPYVNITDSKS